MLCDQQFQNFLVTVLLLLGVLLILAMIFATWGFYSVRRSFHPFFAIIFFVYLLCTTGCMIAATVTDAIKYAGLPVFAFGGYVYFILYRYSTPIVFFFLLERLYATRNCQIYEQQRPWCLFLPLLPLGLLLCLLDEYLVSKGFLPNEVELFSMLGLQLLIIMLMWFLSYYNRRLLRRWIGRGKDLSYRYQLAENIRVLRLVIPVTTWATIVTIESLLGQIFLGIVHDFDLERCSKEPFYLWLYLGQQSLAVSMVFCMPLSIIRGHPAITKAANRHLCFKFKTRKNSKIINVLGLDVKKSQTTEEYFLGLYNEWNRTAK